MKFHNILSRSFIIAGLLALGAAAPASAQTMAGTDDFNDGSLTVGAGQRWISNYDISGGATAGTYAESGGTLNYTSTSEDTQFLRWSGINTFADNDFDHNWTISIDVSNSANPVNGYVTAGLQIYTTYEVSGSLYYNAYYSIMALSGGTDGIVTEWAKYDEGLDDLAITSNFINQDGISDYTIQLSWDATSNLLTASYDTGSGMVTGQTFNLAGAEAGYLDPYNQKMGIELFVRSADGAGLVSGGVSFDNMAVSVSAVPEPSTYAAIAGALMLGFAAWKRRKAKA